MAMAMVVGVVVDGFVVPLRGVRGVKRKIGVTAVTIVITVRAKMESITPRRHRQLRKEEVAAMTIPTIIVNNSSSSITAS